MENPTVDALANLYISYRQSYVMMTPDGATFVPKQKDGVHRRLTNAVLFNHLDHKYAICIYAGPKTSKFICFDVDDGSIDSVHAIMDAIQDAGFPRDRIYVSTSGGKGYHVEVFFDRLMDTEDLRRLYKHVIRSKELDPKKVEFRPTAKQSIKLPLSVHRKTGNICWFLDPETMKPIERQDYLLEIQKVSAYEAIPLILGLPTPKKPSARKLEKSKRPKVEMKSGWPVLKEVGTRHDLMVKLAVNNRRRSLTQEENTKDLLDWVRSQDQELIGSSMEDIEDDVAWIMRWAYAPDFKIGGQRRDSVRFYRNELSCVLEQHGKTARKFAFLVLFYGKVFGSLSMRYDRICGEIGTCAPNLGKIIKAMKNEGFLVVKAGKVGYADGKFFKDRNRYWFKSKWNGGDDRYETVDVGSVDWQRCYRDVVRRFYTDAELKRIMTKKEYEEFERYGESAEEAQAS